MHTFFSKCAIFAFLGVTETIEIMQPLINFFDKDLNTNAYLLLYMRKYGILANRKPLMCIALAQSVLSIFSNMYFSDICAENQKII